MSTSDPSLSPGTGLRLLSFDGGGIRAVSQALMVREIAHRVEMDQQLSSPTRICDHFDMICGSGFGGILAIMCGILEMTGDEPVQEFVSLSKAVFSDGLDEAQRSLVLKNEIKRLIRTYTTGGEERRIIGEDGKCKTFVCAASSQNTSHPRLFRNYISRANKSMNCMLWEAAYATLAMPDHFNPITIRDGHLCETFIGGELRWNNPTNELTKEASDIFKNRCITCIISIGSGHPGHMSLSKGLPELFPRIALDCERTADETEHRFGNTSRAFWRLSVEQGFQHLAFNLSNLDTLVSHTHSYLQNARTTRNIDILLQDLIRRPERIPVNGISDMAPVVLEVPRRKICPCPSQYFTGRRPVLQKLEGYFFSNCDSCRVAVLFGIGGGGKSQIGLQFIHRNRSRFSEVFFIDASSKLTLETDLKAIAIGISEKPTAKDGMHILRTTKEEWLLFLDSADDTTLDLRPYISWSHGNVLITTRNREMRAHAPECSIWVDKLELEEAKELLLKGVKVGESLDIQKTACDIVQNLGCLALAVNQARGFLAQDICTLHEYLPIYMQNRRKLLEDKSIQTTNDYKHTIYTAWTISFNRLTSDAAFLLELLCFMHYDAIPSQIFEDAWKPLYSQVQGAVPTTLTAFLSSLTAVDSTWNILRFRMLIREIISFSLIDYDTDNCTFSLHPLVQQWAKGQSRHSQETIRSTQTLLCLATPIGNHQRDYAMRISILPHMRDSAETGIHVHYSLLDRAGFVYYHGGLLEESSEAYEIAMSESQERLGSEHPYTLNSMSNLAASYSKLGQGQKALQLMEHVLALRTRILGEEHPETLATMGNLATIYLELGHGFWVKSIPKLLTCMNILATTYSKLNQHHKALELDEQVLAVRIRILGEEHPDTLITTGNLAVTHSKIGQYRDALRLEEQVLALRTRVLGKEHPDTLMSMSNLATTYSTLGQHPKALELKEKVLTLRTSILGEEHPDTLTSMNNLAMSYSELGCNRDALKLKEQVLSLRIRILGEEHPDTFTSMNNLATTYSRLGQHRDAQNLLEEVLALRIQILGKEHPDTLIAMGNLATTYAELGQHQDALKFEEQVQVLRTKSLGEEYPNTLTSMNNLAAIYLDVGQIQDALKLEEQVLVLRTQILGEEHPDTLASMSNLATIYSKLGRHRDTLKLEEQVLALRTRILGEEHPNTLTSMGNLAATYSKLIWYRDALKLIEQALAIRTRILGEEHPDSLITMGSRATVYSNLGQYQDALTLEERTLALMVRVLGEEHPSTLINMDNLALIHLDLGQYRDALKVREKVLTLRTHVLGEDHPDTLISMSNLANSYFCLGQSSEALTLYEQVLKLRRHKLGPEHPDTLESFEWVKHVSQRIKQRHNWALKMSFWIMLLFAYTYSRTFFQ
ncbi:hypothetical protein DL96DRAFT_1722748 [Flagelloscypha sp. PMI_526]|nr:hypothetical protein DL96DRAFT_1722748 [Flagelloscypha sp. PMI_526]